MTKDTTHAGVEWHAVQFCGSRFVWFIRVVPISSVDDAETIREDGESGECAAANETKIIK